MSGFSDTLIGVLNARLQESHSYTLEGIVAQASCRENPGLRALMSETLKVPLRYCLILQHQPRYQDRHHPYPGDTESEVPSSYLHRGHPVFGERKVKAGSQELQPFTLGGLGQFGQLAGMVNTGDALYPPPSRK